ncbi:MAG: ATP-binding protein [Alphaproteobacteria bacterium]
MKPHLSRYLPQGLAGRFALLLASALVVANLAALAVLSLDREQQERAAREAQEIERIVALVPALEAVSPDIRQAIARHASTRVARVRIGPQPLVRNPGSDARSRSLRDSISGALGDRDVRVRIRERADREDIKDQPLPPAPPEIITISIALAETSGESHGTWLNVVTRGARRVGNRIREDVFFLVLGVSLFAVLGVGLLFVRRLTQPLSELAQAARSAGHGDHSIRILERGAREMREATAAFNTMQDQIARFEDERTRTLAAVGHDLRTPITSLRIRAEMLGDDAREPIIRTLDEMAVMADGLVAFARGDGDVEEKQAVDIGELLEGFCNEMGAALTIEGDAIVAGRPVALKRAFGNLIDNASRYGHTARVRMTGKDMELAIEIEDDGPGIPPERLDHMFEPFVRGEDSRSSDTGGAGLGLSIARQIIRSHGGTIVLSNMVPNGLKVSVALPRDMYAAPNTTGTKVPPHK